MPGLSDYTALANLAWVTGGAAMPSRPDVFLGLFTAMPTSDAGTGGTEVTGGSYARVQVGGSAVTNNTTGSGNAVLHFATTPAWLVAGMTVRDATSPSVIPAGTTILSTTGTTVTMSANATGGGVGNGDTITFSAWPAATASSGTEPAVTPATVANGAAISFAPATADWGTAIGWGLFDALTVGDVLAFDYLGAYSWLPATMSAASPGVITTKAHGYSAGNNVVVTTKYGGTLPSFSQSNLTGTLAVVSPATDTFTVTNAATAVNTSTTGDFQVRRIATQSIPSGVTASFPASTFSLNAA